MEILNSPWVAPALLFLGGIVAIFGLFFFGQGLLETLVAIVRLFFEAFGGIFRAVARSIFALGWYVLGGSLLLLAAAAWVGYVYWLKPGELNLVNYRPPVCTELLDRSDHPLDYLCPFEGVRIWRPLQAIATPLRVLVVMLEDDKFYEHGGLDVDEIWNALEKDLEKSKIARGGSTITQQLAKNLFLSKEKSIIRKASEVPLALRLERELSKDQILELYLNTIEWGPGVFGAEAASRLYFDHPAVSLTDEESWLMALMIPNPKELNLWISLRAKKSILKRAQHLSHRLYQEHRMSKDESKAAFGRFQKFLDEWIARRPAESLHAGRKYPAKWGLNHAFSLSEIVSIRRGAAGIVSRFKSEPLHSHLDREVQEKLEAALGPAVAHLHANDLSDVAAIVDGQAIRAMVPIASPEMVVQATQVAQASGLQAKVFPARNIPKQALWKN